MGPDRKWQHTCWKEHGTRQKVTSAHPPHPPEPQKWTVHIPPEYFLVLIIITRIHSSGMHTNTITGGCLPQCMLGYTHPLGVGLQTTPPRGGPGDPPQVWAWRPPPGVDLEPPLVWAWRPPTQLDPSTPPPRCGPGDLQGMLGYHPPPVNRQTRVKTQPSQTSFAGGKKNTFNNGANIGHGIRIVTCTQTFHGYYSLLSCSEIPPLRSASGVVILCVVVVVVVVVGKVLLSVKQQLDNPSFLGTSINLFRVCYIIAKQLYKCLQWRIQDFRNWKSGLKLLFYKNKRNWTKRR